MISEKNRPGRLVWDLPLRAFHWLFAATMLALWATAHLGFSWMKWHFWLGYWMMGLVIFRIIWGLVGPRHARFKNFLKGPAVVAGYLRRFATRESVRSVGHNPLGALMVLAMMLLAAIQVVTGLFASDDIAWSGPYVGLVSEDTASLLTRLHDVNFNLIEALVALHVAAILYYALAKGDNLVPPMWNGRKHANIVPADQAIASSELWKAAIVIAISCGVVFWVLHAAPPASPSGVYY
jgi:cytochrome b